ncbi:hypothetical protein [Parvularcula sp. LCG005]|uniref:hypothetical protein n=1 Tax=Parvularcula sp. LCG005 TaxID=3078805 RepID=UPI0029432B1E|nr:hypothetical protein [Parvularcula sp. LCG005]WOI53825.1 hypothetical protein RUI03_02215 [Parvularcula sp. LCG005]
MTDDVTKAREDLAFLTSIVSDHTPALRSTGIVYGAAGLLYGAQCIINWLQITYWPTAPAIVPILHGFLPTVIFLVINVVVARRSGIKGFGSGTAQRAIGAAFAGAGLANLSLIIVFASAAFRRDDFSIWLFFPVTVCALQGAVWFAVGAIRRRSWMSGVAAGWFLTAIITGVFVQNPLNYLLALGIGLILFMAVPGYILMRISKAD